VLQQTTSALLRACEPLAKPSSRRNDVKTGLDGTRNRPPKAFHETRTGSKADDAQSHAKDAGQGIIPHPSGPLANGEHELRAVMKGTRCLASAAARPRAPSRGLLPVRAGPTR